MDAYKGKVVQGLWYKSSYKICWILQYIALFDWSHRVMDFGLFLWARDIETIYMTDSKAAKFRNVLCNQFLFVDSFRVGYL